MNWNTISGIGAVLLWSITVGLARSISEETGPLTAGASVYMTGGMIATVWMVAKKNKYRKFKGISLPYLLICGLLFVIYTTALFLALGLAKDRYQTLEIGLINYLWPALTLIFSILIFRRQARWWLIPATMIALGGVSMVILQNDQYSYADIFRNIISNPAAYGIAFIAALSWALYSNMVRLTGQNGNFNAVPFFILLTGVVLWVMQIVFPEESNFNIVIISEILILGIATAVAYTFWENAMRKGDQILVVSFSYLTPFFSTLFSAVYLKVSPGLSLWIGCLMIILGSWLSWRSVNDRIKI